MMQIFKVGGFVRDTLMGKTPKDVDYVVIGATESVMLDLGFERVGADFPVFLHPDTNEEYALARVERKTGEGYHGFEVDTKPGQLNPELMSKFINLGYDPEKEYSIEELISILQRINQ